MKIIVAGDLIHDESVYLTATRLCPEAPVPVTMEKKEATITDGGAGFVNAQLLALMPPDMVESYWGSESTKKRFFVDDRLWLRIDTDNYQAVENSLASGIIFSLHLPGNKILVISDYGKGAFTQKTAAIIMGEALKRDVPVLVDAKHNWSWWQGAFCFFPNLHELNEPLNDPKFVGKSHIIHKLGPDGCSIDGVHIPLEKVYEVRDVTGAGDVFLAAFAAMLASRFKVLNDPDLGQQALFSAARYANQVAALSVGHLGTFVVENVPKPFFGEEKLEALS